MSQPLQFILGLACAVAAAVLAFVLTLFVGFLSCWVVSWVVGDQNYMILMWVVWGLAVVAMPFGFIGAAVAFDRLMKRRARRSEGVDAPRGFSVDRRRQ